MKNNEESSQKMGNKDKSLVYRTVLKSMSQEEQTIILHFFMKSSAVIIATEEILKLFD